MRRILAGAVLASAAAVAVPAAPASAYCDPLWTWVTGGCTNGCYVTVGLIHAVSPEVASQFACPD